MDSPILKQIANFLQDRKKHKHWTVIFTCMAVLVCLGTVTALKLMGQAMTHKEKVLNCNLEVHTHTEECQDEAGNLICGLADYVVHVHNDDCYDSEGNLVCVLPEIPAHVHSEECYAEEEVLVCGLEEEEGHVHDDTCYEQQVTGLQCQLPEHQHGTGCYDEEGNLVCAEAEHQHTSDCYDEEGNLICGQEAHTHMVSCYDEEGNLVCTVEEHLHDAECLTVEDVLVCELEEGADGHTHTEECYETQQVLVCGQLELHTHTEECYEEIPPAEEGGEPTYNLICELPVLEEHVHSEEAGCFTIVEVNVADAADDMESVVPGEAVDSTEMVDSTEIIAENETEEETETEEAEEFLKVSEGDGYIVSATYGAEAEIPEEAEFIAELITAESDPEHYAAREEEFQQQVEDENATMSALLKVGFYVDGEEIEPKAPVQVTVQLVDENGLPEGMPMTVVHFAEEGNEVLDGGHVQGGKASFEANGFSDYAIGFRATDHQAVNDLDKTYVYEENPAYRITFHLTGKAELPGDEIINVNNNTAVAPVQEDAGGVQADDVSENGEAESGTETEDAEMPDETLEETTSFEEAPGEELTLDEGQTPDEEPTSDEEQTPVTDEGQQEEPATEGNSTEVSLPDSSTEKTDEAAGENILNDLVEFTVIPVDESSEEYKDIKKSIEASANDGGQVLSIFAVSYSLTYEGEELPLDDCQVDVEITPTQKFEKKLSLSVTDAVAYLMDQKVADLTDEEKNITGLELSGMSLSQDASLNDVVSIAFDGDADDASSESTKMSTESAESAATSAEVTGSVTMSIALGDGIKYFAVRTSGQPNPKFTVQYYANLEVVAYNDPALRKVIGSTSYTNELPVIDTTGGKLPANGGGSTASPNGNEIRNLYVDMTTGKLQTKAELTEIYSSRPFEYHKAPTINYMNALVENPDYELKEVWVLKEGEEADSTDKGDWDIHTYSGDLHFTNREVSAESGEYVLIRDGATIRFVYDTTDNDNEFEAAFYDYDIGDGMIYSTQLNAQKQTGGKPTSTQGSGTYHMHTNQSGINSPGNYTGSGAKLAFGNANTGSGLQHELWGGNLLNKANQTQSGHPSVTGSYKGCTFGLVTGLVDGKVQYAGNVNAPNLFNDGSAAGKTSYDDGEFSLTFNRVGDTYTLTTVNGTGTDDLDTFNHPSPNASTVHNHIWTNNFWPMDSAASFGTDGHDMKFGDYTNRENYKFAGQAGSSGGSAAANGTFPWSDDGEDHNSYFGMHYNVEFDLVADYVGPLEYYFFGDDDMWVFLDGRLVCDIGGVHSSVGEYVNLWDYLEKGSEKSAGKHTLSFFYTERGESGSTCWMQFTLPSVSSLTPETSDEDFGHLKIEKTVTQIFDDEENVVDNGDEFTFTVHFTDANGKNLPDDYSYVKYDKDGNELGADLIIWDGGEFTLKNGEYIIVKFLPQGTKYEITEANTAITVTDNTSKESNVEYFTDITTSDDSEDNKTNLEDNKTAEGTIPEGGTTEVQYNNKFYRYTLPETGGLGKAPYTMAGIMVMLGASLMYRKKFRERRV